MSLVLYGSRETTTRAINSMEDIYCPDGRPGNRVYAPARCDADAPEVVTRELVSHMIQHPDATATALAQLVWQRALQSRRPTVWCFRRQRPSTATITQMFSLANVDIGNLLAGCMTESDFAALTFAAGKLAGAKLATCRVTDLQEFRAVLAETRQRRDRPTLVCDWNLTKAEVRAAMKSGIRVLAPRSVNTTQKRTWKPRNG